MQIQAVALEDFVFFDADVDVQITCGRAVRTRFAFAAQADALTVVDAGGNVDLNGFAGFGAAFATAFDTRVFDFLACAVAGRTGLLHLENGLADVYRTGTVTGRTSRCGRAGFCAAAVADIAFFVGWDVDAFFDAFGGVFQRDFDADLQIRALIVWLTAAAPASAEHLAEDVGKVEALCAAESAKTAESARAAAHALLKCGMAVLVIHGAFFFVGQGVVGFLNFFKFFFRLFVAGIAVGVVFHRQLAVGFFDFVVARTARHAECCIKILVAHDSDGC